MWFEGIGFPRGNLFAHFTGALDQRFECLKGPHCLVVERLHSPESLYPGTIGLVRRVGCSWVKDIMEPFLRFFKALILAQLHRNQERGMEK